MAILLQIGVVLLICLLSEIVSLLLPFPFPGSVIAMIILFILLAAGVIKVGHIRQKAEFMLKNMAFFCIPAGVGIMEYFDVLKSCIVPFIVICVVSTILTFAATAGTVALIMRLQHRYRGRKGGDQDA